MGLFLSELERLDAALQDIAAFRRDLYGPLTDSAAKDARRRGELSENTLAAAVDAQLHRVFLFDGPTDYVRAGEPDPETIKERYKDVAEELELLDDDISTDALQAMRALDGTNPPVSSPQFWDRYFQRVEWLRENDERERAFRSRRRAAATATTVTPSDGDQPRDGDQPSAKAYYSSLQVTNVDPGAIKLEAHQKAALVTVSFAVASAALAVSYSDHWLNLLFQLVVLAPIWWLYGYQATGADKDDASWLGRALITTALYFSIGLAGAGLTWYAVLTFIFFYLLSAWPYRTAEPAKRVNAWNDFIDRAAESSSFGEGGGIYRVKRISPTKSWDVELDPLPGTPNPFTTIPAQEFKYSPVGTYCAITNERKRIGTASKTTGDTALALEGRELPELPRRSV